MKNFQFHISLKSVFQVSFVIGSFIFISSCINPPEYNVVPAITFKSISKTIVNETTDSVDITFSFTDGDGDIGPANSDDVTLDIYLTDSRDNSIKYYQLPYITPAGNVKAISGET
ncbi:MAG: hypothetical protein LH629_15840, partial [Ignavibacteria bacterium]|nr:hypothetical protein [Ignavibacteria bacterium]